MRISHRKPKKQHFWHHYGAVNAAYITLAWGVNKPKARGGVRCRTCQGVLHAGSCISLRNSRILCVLGCHWTQLKYQPELHQLACCFANCVNMHPPQSATAPDIPQHSEHSVALQLSCRLPLNAVMNPLHTTPVSATCPLMCSLQARLATLGQAGFKCTKLQHLPSHTANCTNSPGVEASHSFMPAQDAANLLYNHCSMGVSMTLADTPWCSNTHPNLHTQSAPTAAAPPSPTPTPLPHHTPGGPM